MRIIVGLIIVVLLAIPASAQSLKIPQTIFLTGAAVDAVTTYHNLSNGATEGNPFLGRIESPAAVTVAMLTSDTLVLLAARRLRVEHPKLAWTLLLAAGGVHWTCGLHNVSVWPHPVVSVSVPVGVFSRTLGPALGVPR